MAEILLSLTIIGVVAAITLPSLTGNINERTWNTQRKALFARFSQAIALMPALNGYGTLTEGDSSTSAVDTAAETFVTDGLSKVLKINNICDNEHLADCGIPDKIVPLDGGTSNGGPLKINDINTLAKLNSSFTQIGVDTKAVAFETQNGESILVHYNPKCVSDMGETTFYYVAPKMCANFIYDLNGNKGPNTFGKDIGFITVLYPSDSNVVSALPINNKSISAEIYAETKEICLKQDTESRLPTRDEMIGIFYNRKLVALHTVGYWTGSLVTSVKSWEFDTANGLIHPDDNSGGSNVLCVKR